MLQQTYNDSTEKLRTRLIFTGMFTELNSDFFFIKSINNVK